MLTNPFYATGSLVGLLILIVGWAVRRLISDLDKARTDVKALHVSVARLETKVDHLTPQMAQHWEVARKLPKLAADIQWLKAQAQPHGRHHLTDEDEP